MSNTSWHQATVSLEGGDKTFTKQYQAFSFEIRNETSRLSNSLIASCNTFEVPQLLQSNWAEGYIKMIYIDNQAPEDLYNNIKTLAIIAKELHSLVQTSEPYLRDRTVNRKNYPQYLLNYVDARIDTLKKCGFLNDDIIQRVRSIISNYNVLDFSIVHRDLRIRHLLYPVGKTKPTLIDREFTNISDPMQDVAKIIVDGTVNHRLDFKKTYKLVVLEYFNNQEIQLNKKEDMINNLRVFIPIIAIEHAAGLAYRKPEGYRQDVQNDLAFLADIYANSKKKN